MLGEKDGKNALNIIESGAVSVNREGRIFTSSGETGPPRMQVISSEETYEQGFATKGVHAGMVLNVRNIAFDSRNRIYTADFDNTRINVYAPDYAFSYSIGREGINARELNGPRGIAVDPNDELFVLSYYGPCEKRNADGEVVLQFAEPDPVDGPLYFHDVVCDAWGNVYLATRGAGGSDEKLRDDGDERARIYKYDGEGTLLAQWPLSRKDRQARAIAVDGDGNVLVLFMGPSSSGVETYRAH
jgi:sugar lactone lactonase YvrE